MVRTTTSASNIFRRSVCPGSERLEEGLPEEDSEQSKEGQMLHRYAADPKLNRAKLSRDHQRLLDSNDRLVGKVFEEVAKKFGDEQALAYGAENITWWLHRGIKKLFPGHPDLWEYRPAKLLVVIDYKFGYKVVTPASANLQLRSYGVMGAENHDCDRVWVAITQPRLSGDDRLTMALYTRDQIGASAFQLYQIWDDCKKPDAPLVAGDHCQYCRARLAGCPAFEAKIDEVRDLIPLPSGKLTAEARDAFLATAISKASNDDLSRMYMAVTMGGFVKDPLFEEMRRRIKAEELPGYRLKNTGELSDVTDVMKARAILNEKLALPIDKIDGALSMSLKVVQDAYQDLNPGVTGIGAKQTVRDLLGDLIERHPKKPSVEKLK